MNATVCTYKNNRNFWIFGAFFFLYFFIMATCFPFLPIWLSEVIGLNKTETGLVFSCLSLFAILFQPIFGIISDKLGLKKHLLWVITLLLFFFAPFFLYVFAPLLKMNVLLGAMVGGAYIGFAFSGGAGAVEAYIERVSRKSAFEYGKARMFGCFGWGICASTAGVLFNINPDIVFWMGSGAAVLLMLLLILANPRENPNAIVMGKLGANQSQFNLRMVAELFRMPKMWMFILYVVGVACVYDVFDQQFANFFKTFFSSPQRGTEVFGYATTAGELANALIMFCSPWIINRIGAKNTLLLAGTIMSIRIIGSAFATTALEVIMLKMLHALEVPFLLVGSFKYITANFDTRLSATIYLIGFQFAKQGAAIFLSAFAGSLYDRMGFADTYLILGGLALGVTLISVFTLSSPDKKIQPQAKAQEATS
ncbi:TPA: MFS transporter [Serratia fonticola]|uniref:MFS transporter n=1 Tax=Serratia fonticola TaxID=47917 RepID=UPI003987C4F3